MDIEVLSEWLGLLKITKEDILDEIRITEIETMEEMSIALV